MSTKKTLVFSLLAVFLSTAAFAQKFMPGTLSFSHKKVSYITLKNGKQIQGHIKDLDWKKGLIKEIKIKTLDGSKSKINPKDIKHMYLPPSGWDKMGKTLNFLNDATQWGSTDLEGDILKKGYVYLETSEVMIKKKKMTLMLQLVNPTFNNKLKVYSDPFAKETASLGVAGIKVAGGIAKSYYVKKGNNPAYKLEKKNYKDEFKPLYEDCPAISKQKAIWNEFENHVFEYSKCK